MSQNTQKLFILNKEECEMLKFGHFCGHNLQNVK